MRRVFVLLVLTLLACASEETRKRRREERLERVEKAAEIIEAGAGAAYPVLQAAKPEYAPAAFGVGMAAGLLKEHLRQRKKYEHETGGLRKPENESE
jgi:hypothetical protein